ncbi:SCO2525 family SAM-dependent methyltransferase [Streptodolium elevatio]
MPANAAYDWDAFNSDDYVAHNYARLSDADRRILELLGEFFRHCEPRAGARGVDVGSGANLYPALAMLPFCDEITLLEHSSSNLAWLRAQTAGYAPTWDAFWDVLAVHDEYRGIGDPRTALAKRAEVRQADLLDRPDLPAPYDMGTMFFVAESFSTSQEEFRTALCRFCEMLRPGALFAIGFMENSQGYVVGGRDYPAVAVDAAVVSRVLAPLAAELDVARIDMGDTPLRDGYTGMMLARGRVT